MGGEWEERGEGGERGGGEERRGGAIRAASQSVRAASQSVSQSASHTTGKGTLVPTCIVLRILTLARVTLLRLLYLRVTNVGIAYRV